MDSSLEFQVIFCDMDLDKEDGLKFGVSSKIDILKNPSQ